MELPEVVQQRYGAAVQRATEGGIDPKGFGWILPLVREHTGWAFLRTELERSLMTMCNDRSLRRDEAIRVAFVAAQLVRGVLHAGPFDGLPRQKDARARNAVGIFDAIMGEMTVTVGGLFVSRGAEAEMTARLIERMTSLRIGGTWRVTLSDDRANAMHCWLTPPGLSEPQMALQQHTPYIIPFGA